MDVLSGAITAMRTGRPHSAIVERTGRWAVSHPPFGGAGFHVVLQGSCRLTAADGPPVSLGPGDVAFLPCGSAHALSDGATGPGPEPPSTPLPELRDETRPGGSLLMLCGAYLLDGTRPHPLLRELPPVVHLPARAGRHDSLRALVDLLGGELASRGPGTDAIVRALLDALLTCMVRSSLDEAPAGGWCAALADTAITAALNAMHATPDRRWTVAELAVCADLSRSAFARRFTALTGYSPLAYLTWWRMTLAARLLRESADPLSALARQTGYASEYAFANAFKREFGVAPGRYRAGAAPAPSLRSSTSSSVAGSRPSCEHGSPN